ncbi:MAG: MFS transporter [Armatimonadetes bacterium]|nr:MFS transporter [Armatimonadota bacterium]
MRSPDGLEKREESVITRPLILLAITVFIDLLGFGIVLPNLPAYITATLPLPAWLAALLASFPRPAGGSEIAEMNGDGALLGGLLAASYSLTQFLFAPFWGAYSDRAGRRPVILFSLIGIGASYILFGLSNGNLGMLFAARLLAGVTSSASIGVAFAYVADITTPQNRAKGMGLLGACFGLGFAFGPVLGGFLGHINIALPAYVAAGMALANFAVSWFILPESLTKEKMLALTSQPRTSFAATLNRVLRDPAAPLFLITFVLTLGFTAIEQAFGFFLMARGIADADNQQLRQGYLLGAVGVVGIILQGALVGPLVKRFGEGNLIRAGLFILSVGYIVLLQPRSWGWLIFVATVLVGSGRSLIGPSATALISRKANVEQGLIQSSSQGFDALARTIGPLLAGALFSSLGATAPYIFSAGLTVLAFLLTFALSGALRLPDPKEDS